MRRDSDHLAAAWPITAGAAGSRRLECGVLTLGAIVPVRSRPFTAPDSGGADVGLECVNVSTFLWLMRSLFGCGGGGCQQHHQNMASATPTFMSVGTVTRPRGKPHTLTPQVHVRQKPDLSHDASLLCVTCVVE